MKKNCLFWWVAVSVFLSSFGVFAGPFLSVEKIHKAMRLLELRSEKEQTTHLDDVVLRVLGELKSKNRMALTLEESIRLDSKEAELFQADPEETLTKSEVRELKAEPHPDWIHQRHPFTQLKKEKLKDLTFQSNVCSQTSQYGLADAIVYLYEDVRGILGEEFMRQNAAGYYEKKHLKLVHRLELLAQEELELEKELQAYFATFGRDQVLASQTTQEIAQLALEETRKKESTEDFYYSDKVEQVNVKNRGQNQKRDYGVQMNKPNKLTNSFVARAGEGAADVGPILDIGCGYGINTRRALKVSNVDVLAIDLEARNLAVLVRFTPKEHAARLKVSLGKYPDAHAERLPSGGVGTLLMSHIAHYLSPEEEDELLDAAAKDLKPGGMFYFQALTWEAGPYVNQGRGLNKRGEQAKKQYVESQSARGAKKYPTYLGDKGLAPHPQHQDIVTQELKRRGFSIQASEHFAFEDQSPWASKDAPPAEKEKGPRPALGAVGIIAKMEK